jgi:5-(carboxyamino)imidazole ribonucleotide synthase
MTHRAAIDLGVELRVLAASPDEAAVLAGAEHLIGSPDEIESLRQLAEGAEVLTFDHEHAPPEVIEQLESEGVAVVPSARSKRLAQDKAYARERLTELGFPLPPFRLVHSTEELVEFGEEHGWPVIAKSPTGGYDGKGVWTVEDDRAEKIPQERFANGLLLEPKLALDSELAVVVARSTVGETRAFPVAETVQRDAMCREILVPAPVSGALRDQAEELAVSIVEQTDSHGVVAVEMFVVEGELLINELALRPHNSGHFTIEGTETSQFEQHLRAVLGWPLGNTESTAPAVVTVNVVGPADGSDPRSRLAEAAGVPGAHLHLYGKEARPGRKLGHVTVRGSDLESARASAIAAVEILEGNESEEEEDG